MKDIEFIEVTYAERRLEYFIQQRDKAERSMRYWSRRAKAHPMALAYLHFHSNASDAADRMNFYNDIIKMLEGKKVQDELRTDS